MIGALCIWSWLMNLSFPTCASSSASDRHCCGWQKFPSRWCSAAEPARWWIEARGAQKFSYIIFHNSLILLELNIPTILNLTISFQSLKIKQIPDSHNCIFLSLNNLFIMLFDKTVCCLSIPKVKVFDYRPWNDRLWNHSQNTTDSCLSPWCCNAL